MKVKRTLRNMEELYKGACEVAHQVHCDLYWHPSIQGSPKQTHTKQQLPSYIRILIQRNNSHSFSLRSPHFLFEPIM